MLLLFNFWIYLFIQIQNSNSLGKYCNLQENKIKENKIPLNSSQGDSHGDFFYINNKLIDYRVCVCVFLGSKPRTYTIVRQAGILHWTTVPVLYSNFSCLKKILSIENFLKQYVSIILYLYRDKNTLFVFVLCVCLNHELSAFPLK